MTTGARNKKKILITANTAINKWEVIAFIHICRTEAFFEDNANF